MVFTVTYRDATGALVAERVEAASRAACFAQMRARGIAPIRVEKGGAKHRVEGGAGAKSTSVPSKALLAAACAVLLAAGGVWWWLGRDKARPSQVEAPVKPKAEALQAAKPEPRPVAVAVTNPPQERSGGGAAIRMEVAVPAERPAGAEELYMGSRIVGRDVRTNRFGEVSEILTTADGRTHLVQYAEKPMFGNAADQVLAMAVSSTGGPMPPLPLRPGLEADFRKAIETPIIIHDDDPDSVKEAKRRVKEARVQMKDMLDKGMSFDAVMREHQRLWNENVAIRAETMREYRRYVESGDTEGAQEYARRVNGTLAQLGIEGIPVRMEGAGSRRRREGRDGSGNEHQEKEDESR